MLDIEEARRIVLEATAVLPFERVPLSACAGRILAGEVVARDPIPLFSSSAMDGFCVRVADVAGASEASPAVLSVQGGVAAGGPLLARLPPGRAARIMTGAPVPEGAEAVVMKEDADDLGSEVRIKRPAELGENIRRSGEEFMPGDRVIDAGCVITPAVAGLLAALGVTEVEVGALPQAALIVTGSELKPPGAVLGPGQIRDANSYALAAAIGAAGSRLVLARIVADDRDAIRAALEEGLAKADLTLAAGGVSVGDFDFVKEEAAAIGVQTRFWKVAMKPGKPNFFGTKAGRLLFGIPGNPVSALVSFHALVRPALWKMAGRGEARPLRLRVRLARSLAKRTERLEFVRGRLERGSDGTLAVRPLKGQYSHMLGGLARADCLILFPRESERIEAGAQVEVELLRWSDL